jgi:hypothetical protein
MVTTTLNLGGGLMIRVEPVLGRAAFVSLAISGVVAFGLVGVVPAWHAFRASNTLRRIGDGHTIGRWGGRRVLIGAQVAVGVTMMAFASLSLQKTVGILAHDFGADYTRIATAAISVAGGPAPITDRHRAQILHSLAETPVVEAAAIVSGLPIGYPPKVGNVRTARGDKVLHPALLFGSGDTMQTLGLRLLAGGVAKGATKVRVALVTEALASALFGGASPLGENVGFQDLPGSPLETVAIGGVVADMSTGIGASTSDGVLIVLTPEPTDRQYLVVVRLRQPLDRSEWLPDVIRGVAPSVSVSEARSGSELLRSVTAFPTFSATLTLALAVLSMLLSIAGLVGIVGTLVASRTREIGLRIALGANRAAIVSKIVADGMFPVMAGLVIGNVATLFCAAVLGAIAPAFEGPPYWSYIVISLFVAGAGLVACGGPARRVAAIDPATTLREL